ncbi:hypothetical protein Ancab_022582, partial [Ancistrocladus abbreviatus]
MQGPVQDEVIAKLCLAYLEIVKEYKVYTNEERSKVVLAGGLHVIGTKRHESRRIDNQVFCQLINENHIASPFILLYLLLCYAASVLSEGGHLLVLCPISYVVEVADKGDPGSSRFILSLEDNIFWIFGGDRIQ